MQPHSLSAQRCLIIPDVHQDLAWVDRIFAREADYDLVVFLGDYFDTRLAPQACASVVATCAYFDAVRVRLGPRAVFLLGNHDIQYLEARAACARFSTPRHLRYKCGSAFRPGAARHIAKTLSLEFWENARLFIHVNGWLLSHAGLAAAHWPPGALSLATALDGLGVACQDALQSTSTGPRAKHPLLQAGFARCGDASIGGLTWLDWDDEFEDLLPCPQIVGHTAAHAARQNGRSWCLDARQTCYGILTPSGLSLDTA